MSRRLMGPAIALLAIAGCAWTPGSGFGTIAPAPVTAELALGAGRLDAAGGWKTDNGFVVTIDERAVRLQIRDMSLLAPGATGSTASVTFDPANPPAGYTLCHGGHCHRADGALIDYADVQAELSKAGGASAPTPVLSLTPTTENWALAPGAPASITFSACHENCDLPRGSIVGAPLHLARLSATGRTADAPGLSALGASGVAWSLDLRDLTLAGPTLAVAIDRHQPPAFTLGGSLALSDRLFDGIDWARLAGSGAPVELEADAPTREVLVANLAKSVWSPSLTPVSR